MIPKISSTPTNAARDWLISQHATVYIGDLGWKHVFEKIVGEEITHFFENFNVRRDGFWMAMVDGEMAGSISVAGVDERTARIRFFVTDPRFQGQGIGRKLLDEALRFCAVSTKDVYLTTVKGLDAAKHLYERAGFVLTDEHEDLSWGSAMTEQRWERKHHRAHA
jgi:ribosomal protein S18 acetylase RimI-like enzyme